MRDVKTFSDLVRPSAHAPAREKVTVCKCLSDATPERFLHALKTVPSTEMFAVRDFFHSIGWLDDLGRSDDQKARGLAAVLKAAKCPNRSAWTYYNRGGTLFRGKAMSPKELVAAAGTLRYIGSGIVSGLESWGETARFDLMYTSKYPVQSWTNDIKVAVKFTTRAGISMKDYIPVMLRTESIPREQTLFSPEVTDLLFGMGEKEVVRTSNTPIKATAMIPVFRLAVLEKDTGVSLMG